MIYPSPEEIDAKHREMYRRMTRNESLAVFALFVGCVVGFVVLVGLLVVLFSE